MSVQCSDEKLNVSGNFVTTKKLSGFGFKSFPDAKYLARLWQDCIKTVSRLSCILGLVSMKSDNFQYGKPAESRQQFISFFSAVA
jgi:hypothetical protein